MTEARNETTTQETPAKLQRIHEGRMLGGVCAGWARYLGVDVAVVRIMVVAATFVFVGVTIPLYAACYVLTPEEETSGQTS
jgi:phage shock protein PspC (stress-responsive transcriptional regulator)